MRTFVSMILLVSGLFSCGTALGDTPGKIYGKGVAATDTVKVSDLMAAPEAYLGRTIRVQGTAVGVCAHRGCWINVASDQEGQVVRVKVKDGEIVFPAGIVGDQVLAEGVWTSNQLDLDTTRKVCAADAEKHGKDFDPDSVTECLTLYQISGTGAVVVAR